jgi:hypothetical protein
VKPVIVTLVFLLFFSAWSACSRKPEDKRPPAHPDATAATRPASNPYAGRQVPLKAGMEKVSDVDLEGSLERWKGGEEFDIRHVIKRTGVYLKVSREVRWDDAAKRALDPNDYDRLVVEGEVWAEKLLQSANDQAPTHEIRKLSGALLERCTDCHNRYK